MKYLFNLTATIPLTYVAAITISGMSQQISCSRINTTKIHRRYPEKKWDYKAISGRINDGKKRDLIYYALTDKGKRSKGVEMFSGRNYIVGSKDPSYSKKWSLTRVPKKYKEIVACLQKKHRKTKWSAASKVNLN